MERKFWADHDLLDEDVHCLRRDFNANFFCKFGLKELVSLDDLLGAGRNITSRSFDGELSKKQLVVLVDLGEGSNLSKIQGEGSSKKAIGEFQSI